ncbi:ankyrin repeat and LEM domain-containing protein 1-like isoform X2 [Halichondria panicea]|uniref:ankyrin repeat and LEM domain-containing protein 1-like isoform X2 n=1 Tax=Halichondria panicea TaxID=6063 RepID=UPI00312B8149
MDRSTSLTEIIVNCDLSSLISKLTAVPDLAEFINKPVDSGGATLLHLAANSSADILYYLLDNHADPEMRTEDGLTPLHIAAMWGRAELVEALLYYGSERLVLDNESMLPVDYAKVEHHKSCVQLLESEGSCDDPSAHSMTCAESFVAMFKTFSIHEDTTIVHYPDVVEDTFQDEHYLTALSSPKDNTSYSNNSPSYAPPSPICAGLDITPTTDLVDSLECSFVGEKQTAIPSDVLQLSNTQVWDRLIALGEKPGPINDFTRTAYLVYLTKLQSGSAQVTSVTHLKGFRYELSLVLNGVSPIPNVTHLEEKIVQEFSNTPTVTRATNPHTSTTVTCSGLTSSRYHIRDNFNYLLLDPPELASCPPANDLIGFKTFVESIFYIGKGKNSRPIQHLKDAKSALIKAEKLNSKHKRISSIWNRGNGVISLPMFHNTIDGEAFTRECCMIDALGLDNLTNKVRGHVHGIAQQWPLFKRRQYGVYLLHKAFQIFQITSPPQLHEHDL